MLPSSLVHVEPDRFGNWFVTASDAKRQASRRWWVPGAEYVSWAERHRAGSATVNGDERTACD